MRSFLVVSLAACALLLLAVTARSEITELTDDTFEKKISSGVWLVEL